MSTIAMNKQVQRTRADRSRVVAHPKRRVQGASRGRVASCVVERPEVVATMTPWMRLKVAGIAMVATVAAVVGGAGYVQAVRDEAPSADVVSSAAWAHVEK